MDARLRPSPNRRGARPRRPDRCGRVALVLQGGGALGAYQCGVYQALHEAELEPDWVSGVSIGAINAAIIAGNSPRRRVDQLRLFCERITERKISTHTPDGDVFRKVRNSTSALVTMTPGRPGFFEPRVPNPWFSLAGARTAISYYDTAPLRSTLDELVDFSLINEQSIRFSVGAVNVLSGNLMGRHKDIMYSSRTRYNTDVYRRMHKLKTQLYQALAKVPEDRLDENERRMKAELADLPEITILQIIYQQKAYEGHAKDYDFSGTSMREHWQSGYEDMGRTLKRQDWLELPAAGAGIIVHDVHREADQ